MSEMFTKCNGFIVSGDPLVYADSATMTGQGTVSEPFGVKSTVLFVQEPLYTGTSGNSAYIGWNNETVLWSGISTGSAPVFDLSGNISDFEYIEFYAIDADGWCGYSKTPSEYCTTANRIPVVTQHYGTQTKNIIMRGIYVHPISDTHLDSKSFGFDYNGTAAENSNMSMTRIVGINHKEQ